jgi:hypothetical protein
MLATIKGKIDADDIRIRHPASFIMNIRCFGEFHSAEKSYFGKAK